MARSGRKRALKPREPNGRPERPTADQRAQLARDRENVMKVVVLAQPHRMGDEDQLCATALGRFVKAHKLKRELYDAGEEYSRIKCLFRAAIGAPMETRCGGGTGAEIDAATVHGWKRRIDDMEDAMLVAGVAALGWVERLAVDDAGPVPDYATQMTATALLLLAVCVGRVERPKSI